jgi:flavin-dependent dehydrogenase
LLDKEGFPRDKPCGDGLISDALRALRALGLEATVRRLGFESDRLSIFSSSRIEFEVPGTFVTLRRRVLDTLIAQQAVQAGAVFARGAVREIGRAPDGTVACRLAEGGRVCRARLGVVATGARVDLLERLGLVSQSAASGFAMRCYVQSALELDHLIISFDRAIIPGYAWIFPLGDREFNVGCGVFHDSGAAPPVNLREIFKIFTRDFSPARELLAHGRQLTPLRGAMLRCGLEGSQPHGCGGLLNIGETIGATFPFTGEGVGKAMETGALAAATIDEALSAGDPGRLDLFAARIERELKPVYSGYRLAQKWFAHGWVNDLVARRARKSDFLRQAFAGLMTETVNPHAIFSWSGLLRSLWE